MLYKQASLRLKWLDIAKGITIILMVIGHTSIPDPFSRFIFAFHMPLFFIASGWTTNWNKYNYMEFAKRKFRSIMVPFMVYSVIVLSIQTISMGGDCPKTSAYNSENLQSEGLAGVSCLISHKIAPFLDHSNSHMSNDAYKLKVERSKADVLGRAGGVFTKMVSIWLARLCLVVYSSPFFASILSRFVHIDHSSYFHYSMMIFFVFVGSLLKQIDIYLPWALSTVPFACFFILLGTELKKKQDIINTPRWWILVGCFIVTSVISHFWKLDMAWNNILPVIPLITGAITGTIMIFCLSSYIERYTIYVSKVLTNVGQETFCIVAFSQLIIMLLRHYTLLNSITCYFILIVSLSIIIYIKKSIKKTFR